MKRIEVGENVPVLSGDTLSGEKIKLSDFKGSPLILSFYRYAGCQLCNLRIRDFIKRYKSEYEPAGIQTLAVFQSPIKKMKKYTTEHNAPFEFVSDPEYLWYNAFGLENSWGGFLKAFVKPKPVLRSIANGFMRIDPDGSMNRLPADFLINAEGIIDEAFYATDIGEHIPFRRITKWAKTLK